MLAYSKYPYLYAVKELPRIYCFHSILVHIVSNVSEMEAKLSDIEEAEFVALLKVQGEKLDEAVLRDSQRVLDLVATTTRLRFFGKFDVHLLHCHFKYGTSFRLIIFICLSLIGAYQVPN